MKLTLLFSLILLNAWAQPSLAQRKFEREYRLNAENAPPAARQFVDSLDFAGRVKWYAEESDDGRSVEAKQKHERQKYSIEFDTAGGLQDVEIEINCHDLPAPAQAAIAKNLNAEFERFRFLKIQEQLTGDPEDVLKYLRTQKGKDELTVKYEIVLKGREDGEARQYEYTFGQDGTFEKRARVVFRNTDNLEY